MCRSENSKGETITSGRVPKKTTYANNILKVLNKLEFLSEE